MRGLRIVLDRDERLIDFMGNAPGQRTEGALLFYRAQSQPQPSGQLFSLHAMIALLAQGSLRALEPFAIR